LIYADQCPWNEKSVNDVREAAAASEHGIDLNIVKLVHSKEARNAPSGFGVFSLLLNGKILEDNYISK